MLNPEESLGFTYLFKEEPEDYMNVFAGYSLPTNMSSWNFGLKRNSKVWEESSMF